MRKRSDKKTKKGETKNEGPEERNGKKRTAAESSMEGRASGGGSAGEQNRAAAVSLGVLELLDGITMFPKRTPLLPSLSPSPSCHLVICVPTPAPEPAPAPAPVTLVRAGGAGGGTNPKHCNVTFELPPPDQPPIPPYPPPIKETKNLKQ